MCYVQPEIEQSVRRGDLFAIIVEYYYEVGEYRRCLDKFKEMKELGIIITPYIDKEIVSVWL